MCVWTRLFIGNGGLVNQTQIMVMAAMERARNLASLTTRNDSTVNAMMTELRTMQAGNSASYIITPEDQKQTAIHKY